MLNLELMRTDRQRSGLPLPVAVTARKMLCRQTLRRGASSGSKVGSLIERTLNPLKCQRKAWRNKFHEGALFERL